MELTRRSFLSACAALGPTIVAPRRETLFVDTTVFFGHPGGDANLVRFRGENIDAPAGRLRIYDARRELLGTAGMLGVQGSLFGELWMNLPRPTRIFAELETPGRRIPLRSSHLLSPPRKWTLHWITVTDPDATLDQLSRLNPWDLASSIALMRETAVKGNPFGRHTTSTDGVDHIEYLRSSTRAVELERRFGIPASPIAIANSPDLRASAAPLALAGSGIRYALLLDDEHQAFYVYEGRDGSRITTASPPPGGSPRELQFAAGRDIMAGAVESWLTASRALDAQIYPLSTALVVSTEVETDRVAMLDTVRQWGQRFAYPRIVLGDVDEFFEQAERMASARPLFGPGNPMPFRSEPELPELRVRSQERARAQQGRVESIVGAITRLLGRPGNALTDFAEAVDFSFDGLLVFNPSPLPRTDLVRMPDDTERMVTRVPGLGYVFVPNAAPLPPTPYMEPGDAAISGQRFTVRLNPHTGAVSSLYARDTGREWADDPRGGLNAIPTSQVIGLQRYRLPGVGSRLELQRRTTWGVVRTTYSVYDDTPWVDIHNQINSVGRTPVRFEYALDMDAVEARWETAAGYEVQSVPTSTFAHLRWATLRDTDRSSFLIRCREHPYVRIESDGASGLSEGGHRVRLLSITPGGECHYRMDTTMSSASSDEPWRFGWHGEPFVTTRVSRGGRVPVGRFGQFLSVEPGVMVVGVKKADDEFGMIVYLQEVMGYTRDIRVAPEMIQFGYARIVDLAERDLGESLDVAADGVRVPIKRFGIVTLRLAQLSLR